jgi:hypothetical protein
VVRVSRSSGTDARASADTITPAAADADTVLGPVRGHTSTSGAIERDRTPTVGVCLHRYGDELGLTIGGDDGPLAVEATGYLTAADARDLAARLEAAADELDGDE